MISSAMHSEMRSSGINVVTEPLRFPSESTELAQQHSAQQCVRNLIRARDTVLVTSVSNRLTIELCDFLLVVTFVSDDPTRLVLHGTSDVDRTLFCSSCFFTVFFKIHRLHLIALDRCERPRTSPTSRAAGLSPSRNFVKHVILSRIVALCARPGLSFRTIDSKLPC